MYSVHWLKECTLTYSEGRRGREGGGRKGEGREGMGSGGGGEDGGGSQRQQQQQKNTGTMFFTQKISKICVT